MYRIMSSPAPVPFHHIHQIIGRSSRFSNRDIRIVYLVLAQYGLDFIVVYIRQWDGIGNSDAALFLPPYDDSGWSFIQPDTKPLELGFDDLLVTEGFKDIEDDEDEVTCTRDCGIVGEELYSRLDGYSYRQ